MTWKDWPTYSAQCRRDVNRLLGKGKTLTAYRSNPKHGIGPWHGSWAWRLEREAEQVHEVRNFCVVACHNGTLALTTLLKVLYPEPGEIITSAMTFSATPSAILLAGHTPVFADVSIPACTLDPESVARMRSPHTVGIVGVDLFGRQWLAGEHPVDACQAVGLTPVAAHGVWSFNGRKNVPAGEGGAIFTQDLAVAERCRFELNHPENFGKDSVGVNGHLNEVTACVAYHGMKQVWQRNDHRTRMAQILNESLALSPVVTPDLSAHALYMYPLIVERGMERMADTLLTRGVAVQRGYIQPPLHEYPAFREFRRDLLPNTERLSRDQLLLFPQVTPTATRQEMEQLGDDIRASIP